MAAIVASLLARLASTPGWWAMCEAAAWEPGSRRCPWAPPEEPLLLLPPLLRTPLVGVVSEGMDVADWLRYMWEGPDEEVA